MSNELRIFGEAEDNTVMQMMHCLEVEEGSRGVLCADNHLGYQQPIGAAVAYREHISPAGVGYDIGCGNKAVLTNVKYDDIMDDLPSVMKQIATQISFGVGRKNKEAADHEVLDKIKKAELPYQRSLLDLAYHQLGTVGSGNHYVDLFKDNSGSVWVGVHFGSRGFGHKTATHFLELDPDKHPDKPFLLRTTSEAGQAYISAMQLAGEYAYAGRDWVVNKVLSILGAESTYEVHNHHNFTWEEEHFGEKVWVVRKGCTPAFPGQQGFVGGSMGDISVILEGKESRESPDALYSTVHGAGRLMSRTKAAGKWIKVVNEETGRKRRVRDPSTAAVNWELVREEMENRGIVLIGGGADEAPQVYKRLRNVLDAQGDTIEVKKVLQPIGVVMAGATEFDPYKD